MASRTSSGALAFTSFVLGCLLAPSSANLLCSGSDPTCQVYLPEAAFYAQSNASNFVYDMFSDAAKASAITSNKFPDSGIMVTGYSASNIPMAQLPDVDFSVLYWWMPNGSVSMPHFHSNALEWGFVTKGSGYACMADMSKATDGVGSTPQDSTYRFICNKLAVGQMYMIPPGWIHFLFYPCQDTELLFGFSELDFNNVNVVNAFEIPIPQDKYVPGAGVTVEEMDDIISWVNQAQEGYVYGDSHLYMGSAEKTKEFCAKYPPEGGQREISMENSSSPNVALTESNTGTACATSLYILCIILIVSIFNSM